MSMNNNTFAHLYNCTERSKTAANDFYGAWKRMIVSTKFRTGIVEFTMVNNDVHVFLSYISYPQWCCGRTYYMDGILYRGEYPYNRPMQKEKNMENNYTDMEIEKARKDGYATAMDEAHEAMIELFNLDYDTSKSIFGYGFSDEVVKNYDIRTIIGKLHGFKEKNEIRVGDEYISDCDTKVVVTSVRGISNVIYFLSETDDFGSRYIDEFRNTFKKTGKNYPELVKILRDLKHE